jgi:hypothetical protein
VDSALRRLRAGSRGLVGRRIGGCRAQQREKRGGMALMIAEEQSWGRARRAAPGSGFRLVRLGWDRDLGLIAGCFGVSRLLVRGGRVDCCMLLLELAPQTRLHPLDHAVVRVMRRARRGGRANVTPPDPRPKHGSG